MTDPIGRVLSIKDVRNLFLKYLCGRDLSSAHDSQVFDCIQVMKDELISVFRDLPPNDKISLMYKIYYGGRRNWQIIILVSLQVPDPFFTNFFIDFYTKVSIAQSRGYLVDLITKKIIKKAAELDTLDRVTWNFTDKHNIETAIFGTAKRGSVEQVDSLLEKYSEKKYSEGRYVVAAIRGAARGGHLDMVNQYCLIFSQKFKQIYFGQLGILIQAVTGGHRDVFDHFYKESNLCGFLNLLFYGAAKGDNIDIIQEKFGEVFLDTAVHNVIDGYVRRGHAYRLPSADKYNYNNNHVCIAITHGHVSVLRKIWSDKFFHLVYESWFESCMNNWPDIKTFGEEVRLQQNKAKKKLEDTYGQAFTKYYGTVSWVRIQKDMEQTNNVNDAMLLALRSEELGYVNFYFDKGATNKKEAIEEAEKMQSRKFTMNDLALIFEEVNIYEEGDIY